MKIVVIGAVAAGTSAAAKARRNDDSAEIVIYDKDRFISYSGCGLPYFIGNEIEDIAKLTPRDPAFFMKKYNIDVRTEHEVLNLNTKSKTLEVKNLQTGETFTDCYDKLVVATGATPFIPPIEGVDKPHVFTLRNPRNAIAIRNFINENKPEHIVIAGTGFIGFELLENLQSDDTKVTVVEMMDKITPNLDQDMATYLENILIDMGLDIRTSSRITAISDKGIVINGTTVLSADMVILATGVRPNTGLAEAAGIKTGKYHGILVNGKMETSAADVYACGDCIETYSAITGKQNYRPLGSTANKTGRIAGDVLTGGTQEYRGNLGTGIFKLFDYTIATTGLSEKEAIEEGYDIVVHHNIKPDRPAYYHGEEMLIKGIADKRDGRLLGVQIIGKHGVDKRTDVFATLITYKAKVDELFHLDLAYAPPFSTTKDPVHYTGMALDNAISRGRELITSEAIRKNSKDIQIIDARSESDYSKKGCVDKAVNIPHARLRETIAELDPNKITVTYCNKGVTGNAAQNILLNHGFTKVYNLSGGHRFYIGTSKKEEKDK